MILVPSVDLEGWEAVKRVRGVKGTGLRLGDPARLVDKLASVGFKKIHVVDLTGAEQGSITEWALRLVAYASREWGLQVRVGGGLRSLEDAVKAVEAGASELVLGTLWAKNPLEARRITSLPASVWAAVDEGANGEALVHGWRASSGVPVEGAVKTIESLGFKGVLYTYTPGEGLMEGIPRERIARVRSLTRLRLAYAGGVSSLEDLDALKELGVDETVVGMALYTGKIPLEVAARYA